ncbi:DUF6959 family protein [Lysobacter sp. CA199]|uniref:DUF6959 family protein n=1 Tax=Lysobacter sp. CA199 TaxID=3455608 RepID=UPI003F8D6323
MHIQEVEIYSDQTNAAIMRHPGRRFPGMLIQGDTLHSLCMQADRVCDLARGKLADEEFEEIDDLRNWLRSYLSHYKAVLDEHRMPLPFDETYGL